MVVAAWKGYVTEGGRGALGGEGASADVLGHSAGVPIGKCHFWGILERTRERPGGA